MSNVLENFDTVVSRIENPVSRRIFFKVVGGVLLGAGAAVYDLKMDVAKAARSVDIPMVMFHLEPASVVQAVINRYKSQGRRMISVSQAAAVIQGDDRFGNERLACLTFDDGYLMQHDQIMPVLRRNDVPGTFFVLSWSFWGDKVHTYMRKPDKVELVYNNGEIQSHGISHKRLDQNFETDSFFNDIYVSKIQIEGDLMDLGPEFDAKKKVSLFAYPMGAGAQNPKTQAYVRDAGYIGAVSTIGRTYQTENLIYEMGRLRP